MLDLFSPMEQKVLEILGKKKMLIIEITQEFYDHKKHPIGANNGIGNAVRKINAKCKFHHLPWFLNGMGSGRAGRTVWKDQYE